MKSVDDTSVSFCMGTEASHQPPLPAAGMKRYIAFPSIENQIPLDIRNFPTDSDNWRIVVGPTTSGLYLLEADDQVAAELQNACEGFYLLMEDFPCP